MHKRGIWHKSAEFVPAGHAEQRKELDIKQKSKFGTNLGQIG